MSATKSPFPGMDPYLERHWRYVHASLVLYARNQLQPQLGGELRARVEERIIVESPGGLSARGVYPDVRVIEQPTRSSRKVSPAAQGVAVAEPIVIQVLDETHTEGFIQILDAAHGNRIVTVIEVLSPTNKRPGPGRDDYRRKQEELWAGGVSLVEIDLLRGGGRTFAVSENEIPPDRRSAYAACVHRGYEGSRFEVYPMPLRERLPAIRIPLRAEDPDAVLDLQALVDRAYADGGYDDIDYAAQPDPPFDPADAAWAAELLKTAGLR